MSEESIVERIRRMREQGGGAQVRPQPQPKVRFWGEFIDGVIVGLIVSIFYSAYFCVVVGIWKGSWEDAVEGMMLGTGVAIITCIVVRTDDNHFRGFLLVSASVLGAVLGGGGLTIISIAILKYFGLARFEWIPFL